MVLKIRSKSSLYREIAAKDDRIRELGNEVGRLSHELDICNVWRCGFESKAIRLEGDLAAAIRESDESVARRIARGIVN